MKVMEVIHRIDELKPNNYTINEKIAWLSTLDGLIKSDIIDTHEGGENIESDEYSASTTLIVPEPYDNVYLRWIEAQIDYTNGEYGKYNNSLAAFNDAYANFENYYNRTHMPKSKGKFKF